MKLSNTFQLGKKHWLSIVCTTIVCGLLGLFVGGRLGAAHYDNSIFIDFSIQDNYQKTSSYENLEAADQITESVQGWIKDISFPNSVNQSTQQDFSIQSKRQEKNNLIITYSTPTSESGKVYGEEILRQLQIRISQYNSHADFTIFANNQPVQTIQKTDVTILYVIAATILGIILGFFFARLYEKIS